MNAIARNFQVAMLDVIKNNPGANLADSYRAFVRYAINRKLAPDLTIDLTTIQKGAVFFPPALSASVQAIADELSLTFQVTVAGLAQAGADQITQENKAKEVEAPQEIPFKTDRPAQATFFKEISKGLSNSNIVVAEASTGVGKGRALMAAAIQSVHQGKTPVIVAAPTILVVNQLWGELQTLRADGFGSEVNATILPGSSEFADDVKLLEWFEDEAHQKADPKVFEWIKTGALHTKDDAIGQVAIEQGINLAWMFNDLSSLAENMPIEDFVLRSDNLDQTKNSISRNLLTAIRCVSTGKSLNRISEKKGVADIIICTHAMLCIGQKTKWAVIPEPSVVIIDEAHTFEETLSRINSHQISLFAIRYKIGRFCKNKKASKNSIPKKALELAKNFMKLCQSFSETDTRERIIQGTEKYASVLNGVTELANMLRSKAFASDKTIQNDIAPMLSLASKAMENKSAIQTSAYLQFSPDKRYPLISIGADYIDQEAGAIWKAAKGGVILASATMYLTDEYGNQKCDYVVRNLAVPITRLYTFAPIESKYIYTIPTLHIPDDLLIPKLSRPSEKDRIKDPTLDNVWYAELAKNIVNITKTAKGGTLVLTSSYSQIAGIEEEINKNSPELTCRLVIQKRGVKFSKSIDAFKAAHKEGVHPILLSLGPAWTGLDLADKEQENPMDDTLLTNLIVACCPIGLNQSPTMLKRIEMTHTAAIAKEALLVLKQGLGRLIRRNGVTDRHIWILDGRIWSNSWLQQFTKPVKRLLMKYKTTVKFH